MLLKITIAMLGIALICLLLLATNILPAGPCGSGSGWYALEVMLVFFPLSCLLFLAQVVRWVWRRSQAKAAEISNASEH